MSSPDKLKVALLTREYPPEVYGGAGVHVEYLARELAPFVDLTSGYIQRAVHELPRQGSRSPWRVYQNYLLDRRLMRRGTLEDEGMTFQRA